MSSTFVMFSMEKLLILIESLIENDPKTLMINTLSSVFGKMSRLFIFILFIMSIGVPAIISADGVIWNANRRIAIRRKLHVRGSKATQVDAGDPKWNKVKAVKLPSLTRKQLKQLEHRLQMAKTFKQDYGSITLRLRCREALTGNNPWTFEELNKFLYKPKEYIKGTKMNFAGLNKVKDRANLILWLRQHSDNPVPLP